MDRSRSRRKDGTAPGGAGRESRLLSLRACARRRTCSPSRRDKTGNSRQKTGKEPLYTRRPGPGRPSRRGGRRGRDCSRSHRPRVVAKSFSRCGKGASSSSRRGTTMTSSPGSGVWRRNSSRARRFARLRTTAEPSFRVAATPTRDRLVPFGVTNRVMNRPCSRTPRSYACSKSGRRRTRWSLGSRSATGSGSNFTVRRKR